MSIFSTLLVVFFAFAATPALSADFQAQVMQEVASPAPLTDAQLETINNTQYIFIDGTLGEVWQSNFDPAEKVLNTTWTGAEGVIIRPHTPNTIPDNAEILFNQIVGLRSTSKFEKAVIIAHSKGSAEVLLMALRHPELSTQYGIVGYGLVAGPYAGTDVIDYVENACANPNAACNYLDKELPFLRSFTPSVIKPIFQEALMNLSESDRLVLEPQIFYIRLQMPDDDVISPLYATHLYLSLAHPEEGPNDGLIPTANERLFEIDSSGNSTQDVFGTDLGIMIGDHNSVTNKAFTTSTLQYREAFFRSLAERMLL
jgi:pimeloyl-ACP methyl ester carboxylesterase